MRPGIMRPGINPKHYSLRWSPGPPVNLLDMMSAVGCSASENRMEWVHCDPNNRNESDEDDPVRLTKIIQRKEDGKRIPFRKQGN